MVKFKVGDRVSFGGGCEGVIRHINPPKAPGYYATEQDVPFDGHFCDGLVPSGRGWYSLENDLKLVCAPTNLDKCWKCERKLECLV